MIANQQYTDHLQEMLTATNEKVEAARSLGWSPSALQMLLKDQQALTYAVSALDRSPLPAELLALAEGRTTCDRMPMCDPASDKIEDHDPKRCAMGMPF